MKVAFAEWVPDLQDTNSQGAVVACNVVPAADGYRPLPGLQQFTPGQAISAYARGAISIKSSGGTSYVYAGSGTKLYALNSAAWTDVTRSSGGNYTNGTEDMWEFVQWGETCIGTNYADVVQTITLGGANFAALSGSPPKARHIAVVRDFVVLANINDGTEKTRSIRWSGFGDETAWTTNPANQSDVQELPGGGRIVRVIGGEEGTIFSEYAITKMIYEGPPTTFRFNNISTERGALSPGAVIDGGGIIFFIGLDDFYMMQGEQITSIGANKVARTFFADLVLAYAYRISGVYDKQRSLAIWSYPGAQSSSGQPNKLIMYHWPTGRWACGEVQINSLFSFLAPGFTLDTLDTISSSLDALEASLDSTAYQGGAMSLGAFNTTHEGVTFSGTPLTAKIETAEIQNEGIVGYVSDAFPVIEGGSYTVEHGHRYLSTDSVTYEPAVSQNAIGGFSLRKINRFHRLRVNISGEWSKAKEVEMTIKQAGRR